MKSPLKVLMLIEPHYLYINTIRDFCEAFDLFSRHHISYAAASRHSALSSASAPGRTLPDFSDYDVVCIHYSVRVAFWDRSVDPKVLDALERFEGYKMLFIQDEYDNTEMARRSIVQLGINTVFTCVPEKDIPKVYPPEKCPGVRFVQVLTGYIPPALERMTRVTPLKDRPHHVIYRGRSMHYVYGDLSREKIDIAKTVRAACLKRGQPADIEWTEEKRIYSWEWKRFLQSGRATLGTESGCNVFDLDGSIRQRIDQAMMEKPGLTYEEAKQYFEEGNLGVRMNQISPKFFEFIAAGTALILYEGEYSGILQAHEHFYELRKDGSNIDEVLDCIADLSGLFEMVRRTYHDIVGTGKYSFRLLVDTVERQLEEAYAQGALVPHKGRKMAALHAVPLPSVRSFYLRALQRDLRSCMITPLEKKRADFDGMIGRRREKAGRLRHRLENGNAFIRTKELAGPALSCLDENTIERARDEELQTFITPEGETCLNTEYREDLPKVALITIPKAGTYLAAAVLDACGFTDCGLHIAEKYSSDKRGAGSFKRMRTHPEEFLVSTPMERTIPLVLEGQYFCAHLEHSQDASGLTEGFTRVLLHRPLREVIISYVRFISERHDPQSAGLPWRTSDPLREKLVRWLELRGDYFFSNVAAIADWMNDEQTTVISYRNLKSLHRVDQHLSLRRRLCAKLHVHDEQLRLAAETALRGPSLTKNPVGSTVESVWDEDCEAIFRELKFDCLDEAIAAKGSERLTTACENE